MGFEDKKMQRQRHKRSKSCTVPEKKKLEDENSIDSSLDVSQRLKLDLPRCGDKSVETKKDLSPDVKFKSSLKQEIQELEKRLQNQFDVRGALEKALGYKTPSRDIKADSTPKPPTELIKEIAVLELEVSHLEQYLLSLYRKAFDQQTSSVSPPTSKQQSSSSPKSTLRGKRLDFSRTSETRCFSFDNRLKSPRLVEKELESPNLRCRQESLATQPRCFSFDNRLKEPGSAGRQFNQEDSRMDSQCFSFDNRVKEPVSAARQFNQESSLFDSQSFSVDNRLKEPGSAAARQFIQENSTIDSRCFSFDNRLKDQCFMEKEDIDSCVRRCQSSLNQRSTFNNRISPPEDSVFACHSQPLSIQKYIQNGSNAASLAEHMGTRISDHIFMTPNKLSEEMIKCVSAIYSKLADPPSVNHGFSSPSSSPSSTSEFSPQDQYDMWSPSFRKNSSFDDQFEFSGPYSSMIEVSQIHRNHRKGRDLDLMNRNFSLLIKQLESVDPRKLTHQEKLAFWINVHNALVMHTFLASGIPQNNGKRFLLLSKPAYKIGGRMVSVEAIQSYILRIKMPRPGQWLKLLLIPKKFRTGDVNQEYSLEHSEPLLYFALCSGNHSDPAIRVYTPKGIYQELETAKEEYIRATFGVKKDQKLVLPKIIESFSKDSGLSQAALMEMIQKCLPETMKKTIKKLNSGRSRKSNVEWTPHSFVFRYLIARELVR
ncbi:hypothetical protein ISN45_Aa04g003250 [Arabidopsis thaliana x Arabidopsis arenosa]|uniref:DUF547 domain-containing protein n=1 Tax=Arabidopsis thaliana x Arabidopsis arenosa TaxID=1240361 RepID=A0A8T2A489_9BRAS|nr:hypothetical protein ISN45_Aa04g003250 [Arabidopsis thaliana x Arabidopsis arenosa]